MVSSINEKNAQTIARQCFKRQGYVMIVTRQWKFVDSDAHDTPSEASQQYRKAHGYGDAK